MTLRICVSILPKTNSEASMLIEKAEKVHADLIEVRLDCLKNPMLADLASQGRIPKIATIRLSSCQGKFSGTPTEQQRLLHEAAKNGFEYVDVDLSVANPSGIKALQAKSIVSFHDFNGSLSLPELNSVLEKQIQTGADVCKIVTTANKLEDNLPLLQFTSTASARAKLVCFAMGKQGKISRLLSPVFGAFFTFASLDRETATAPGQMSIEEMRSAYGLLGIN